MRMRLTCFVFGSFFAQLFRLNGRREIERGRDKERGRQREIGRDTGREKKRDKEPPCKINSQRPGVTYLLHLIKISNEPRLIPSELFTDLELTKSRQRIQVQIFKLSKSKVRPRTPFHRCVRDAR